MSCPAENQKTKKVQKLSLLSYESSFVRNKWDKYIFEKEIESIPILCYVICRRHQELGPIDYKNEKT